jgi:hypothetical protein
MSIKIDANFSVLVDEVAREIISTEHFGGASLIKTPLMYPSGASVVVQITQQQDRFFVTDMGMGHQESMMFDGANFYLRNAKTIADNFGVRFDNEAFFVAEATKEQLPGATVIIANCSAEATALAAYRAAAPRYEADTDRLYQKLISVFSTAEVDRDVSFVGSSANKWPVNAVVHRRGKTVLFEAVVKNHLSVVNTTVKFHDIARLDNPPNRVSVVSKKSDMGQYLNLLSQAGNIVEFDVPENIIRGMADAA